MSMRSKRVGKLLYRLTLTVLTMVLGFSALTNLFIISNYNDYIYTDIAKVPKIKVGLVLGTSKMIYGHPNLYYDSRIQAASALYHAGKIEKLLLSGDNSDRYYDEPRDMKKDLLALGVAEQDIVLDSGGLRTLDSVIRANEVFALKKFIVISQAFHCRRALFIARSRGIEAIAFATPKISHPGRFKLMVREFLARINAGIDIWLINKEPKYLGKAIPVPS